MGRKLLIWSVALNVLALTVGGLYVYKTRDIPLRWYETYVLGENGEAATEPPQARYHRQRVSAFDFLADRVGEQRLIVFAGDSHVQTFGWSEYFAGLDGHLVVANRGVNGDTIDQVIERARVTFLADRHPEKIFLMVGVNDVDRAVADGAFTVEKILNRYIELLNVASVGVPPSRICIHSILPVRGKRAFLNESIRSVNASLRAYAGNHGYCYVDAHPAFADQTGQLRADYAFDDGIHLSAAGYRRWTDIVTPLVLN